MHSSRSHDAVIRVYDDAGNVIQTHEHSNSIPMMVMIPKMRRNLAGVLVIPQFFFRRITL